MGRSMSLVNVVTTVFCVVVTVVCFLRLATAAIATACAGDKIGDPGGCTDDAISDWEAAGGLRPRNFSRQDVLSLTGLIRGRDMLA
eukprot:COSAG02_NODE_3085_length_7396_cov_7.466082_1_plen_85_part_10